MESSKLIEKFSETKYVTEQELKAYLGDQYELKYWSIISNYRSKREYYINLNNVLNTSFKIVYPLTLLNLEFQLSHEFNSLDKNIFKHNFLSPIIDLETIDIVIETKILSDVAKITRAHGKEVNREIIKNIAIGKYEIKETDRTHIMAVGIFKFLLQLDKKLPINLKNLTELYQSITNDDNVFATPLTYRPKGYAILSTEKIKEKINELLFWLEKNEGSIQPTLSAVSTYFYVKSIFIFNKYNDLMAILLFIWVLNKNYKHCNMLEIFSLFTNNVEAISYAFENTLKSNNDLTFLAMVIYEKLKESLVKVNSTFDKIFSKNKDVTTPKNSLSYLYLDAVELEHKYPDLTKHQARFFVSHRKIGSFYTIQEYHLFNDTVYETARKSMEKLAELGLYRKTKNGKKFIYYTNEDINENNYLN